MKKKRGVAIGQYVLLWVSYLLLVFIFLAPFFLFFYNFKVFPSGLCWLLLLALSVVISLVIVLKSDSVGRTRFGFWLFQNRSRLFICWFILAACCVSLQTELTWTLERAKELLSLQWSIFGISITIFLVWHVLILEYLKGKQPKPAEKSSFAGIGDYLKKKKDFSQNVSSLFNTVTLLTLNMLLLLVTTAFIYINDRINLLGQTLTIISFYFCTNTVICLFVDILTPLKEEKEKMMDGMRVTYAEEKVKNTLEDTENRLSAVIEKVDQCEDISDREKEELKQEMRDFWYGEKGCASGENEDEKKA